MWNGFLEEKVSFKCFPVNDVLHDSGADNGFEDDEDDENDEDEEGFIVGK